jgi:D-sedoheptulose 7-phosphate isomerase
MHSEDYLAETADIARTINGYEIERMAEALSKVEGRVYMVGLGGSLANCIHMAADLRKLCNIDAVAPDNIAELTAWANDEGLECLFDGYLSHSKKEDALFVLSVGGGTSKVSTSLSNAIAGAKAHGICIFGIVGPNGGHAAAHGDYVIKIPAPEGRVTPHTEAFQAVIWHCLVSHPLLQKRPTKW